MLNPPGQVCATKGGMKFTYFNACYAAKDGATSATPGACKAAKGGGGKKAKKKKKRKKDLSLCCGITNIVIIMKKLASCPVC